MNAGAQSAENRELLREETAIARRYLGRVPWEMVCWGFANFTVWLSLWPLVFLDIIPLWLGAILASLCACLSYLPSHEAQHSIIAAEGKPLRWLNQLLGHVSTIPIVLPYKLAWLTHRMHHAHTNDPELDPDYYNKGETVLEHVWNSIQGRQPGANSAYRAVLKDADEDPEVKRAFAEAITLVYTYYGVLCICAWSGYALEALFLWWLPRHIGSIYLTMFLSWLPHYPMEDQGRYRDTRAWKAKVGTVLSSWMEFHLVHHLYPTIPLFDTRHAYYDMRELLIERGIRNDGL